MQAVSAGFNAAVAAPITQPRPACLISWDKNIDTAAKFFQLDMSYLDSNDNLKGPGGTLAYFDRYRYVNETEYVQNYSITKKVSSRPWGVIMAQAEINLNNTSKRFLPGFDPTIGNYILRDRPVKLGIGYGNEYINLFVGYCERPKNTYNKRITTLQCFDAMTYLSRCKSNLGVYVNTPATTIIYDLLVEQGFAPSQFSLDPTLQIPIGYFAPKGKTVTDMFEDFCEAEGALMFVDEQGIIQFWNRLHFIRNNTSKWAFNYSNAVDLQWDSTNVINDVLVTSKPLKPAAFNKLYELSGGTGDTMIPPGGSIDIFAEFKDDVGSFPAISVDLPVHVSLNAGSSNYSTNYNKDGTGDPGNAFVTLTSVYNFGESYRMTFSNSGALPIYITALQLFGQPAKVTALATSPQIDNTSIGKYGLNPDDGSKEIEITNDLIQDVASANTMGQLLVSLFAEPMSRIKMPILPVPQLQIGDAVTTLIEDTAQSLLTYVMGYDLFFGVDANLTQSLFVEARPNYKYFQLDLSNLDGSDKLAL